MSLPVTKTLETIADVQAVVVDGIALAKAAGKGALGIPALLSAVLKVAADVKEVVADAPAALPELKDLDASETGKVAEATYALVKAVVAALAA